MCVYIYIWIYIYMLIYAYIYISIYIYAYVIHMCRRRERGGARNYNIWLKTLNPKDLVPAPQA